MTENAPRGDVRDLAPALRAHLDDEMLSARELDADLALVLARRPRRRSLMVTVGVPGALAAAALALFVVARGPAAPDAPPRGDDGIHIFIADSGDAESAIVIDFTVHGDTP